MALYWPAFEFSYSLDMSRLLPYLAAIESSKAAAFMKVVPPQWRQRSAPEGDDPALLGWAKLPDGSVDPIQLRKQQVLLSNASRAHAWVRERFRPDSAPLCMDDLVTMHRLAAEDAGVRHEHPGVMRQPGFRVITGSPGIGFHSGAPSEKLPRLMEQYFRFVNGRNLNSLPAAIHALIAHFFITTIHPFEDGNGRVSRLVAAAILFQRGYRGHGYYALSYHFYLNEEKYHRLLFERQQDPSPDLTEFVAFGLEGLARELQGLNTFVVMKLQRNLKRIPTRGAA